MTRGTEHVACPRCETGKLTIAWSHDPGCRYTKNGDGWPPSDDYDLTAATCDCWSDDRLSDEHWTALWDLVRQENAAGDDDFGQYDYEETEER